VERTSGGSAVSHAGSWGWDVLGKSRMDSVPAILRVNDASNDRV
jgi:hypothetical protein